MRYYARLVREQSGGVLPEEGPDEVHAAGGVTDAQDQPMGADESPLAGDPEGAGHDDAEQVPPGVIAPHHMVNLNTGELVELGGAGTRATPSCSCGDEGASPHAPGTDKNDGEVREAMAALPAPPEHLALPAPQAQVKRPRTPYVMNPETGDVGHWVTVKGTPMFLARDNRLYESTAGAATQQHEQRITQGMADRRAQAQHAYRQQDEANAAQGTAPDAPQDTPHSEEWGQQYATHVRRGQVLRDSSQSHPVHEAHVNQLLDYYDTASQHQHLEGERWYPMARSIAERWAELSGLSVQQVAGIMAASSQQTAWDTTSNNNLAHAHECIMAHNCGHWMDPKEPKEGRTSAGAKMAAIRGGGAIDEHVLGPKVYSFYRNILGNQQGHVATIDRHMMAIFGHEQGESPDANRYDQYRRTITEAARRRGVAPEVLQATAWTNYQQGDAKVAKKQNSSWTKQIQEERVGQGLEKFRPNELSAHKKMLRAQGQGPVHPAWQRAAQRGVDLGAVRDGGSAATKGTEAAASPALPAPSPSPAPLPSAATRESDQARVYRLRHPEKDGEKQEDDAGKRGWMTIRRKHKKREETAHVYVAHTGEILAGPDHLIGRHIEDLRGEGTDEPVHKKEKPEPYDRAGRLHPRGGSKVDPHAAGHSEKGREEREADSRQVYGHRSYRHR